MSKMEEYRLYYDLVLHESKAVWDTGQLFLVANTFLAAILTTNLPDLSTRVDTTKSITFFALIVLGFLISVLWLFSFKRTKKYYYFRMAQARKFENGEKSELPQVFSGDAYDLANGSRKIVEGEKYDLKVFGIIDLSSLKIVEIVIWLFILFYFSIFCINLLSIVNNYSAASHKKIYKNEYFYKQRGFR